MSSKETQNLIDNAQAVDEQVEAAPKQAKADNPNLKTVELDDPISRGNTVISTIGIRKPRAGELRGVSLIELANVDVLALRKVLPRITSPSLTDAEVGLLSVADMMQFGIVVAGFLLTKQQKADSEFQDA